MQRVCFCFQMVISKVSLQLMDFDELFKVVRASPLVNSDRLLDAIQIKTTSKDIPYRGVLCTSEYQFEYYKFISRDYIKRFVSI